MSRRKKSVDFEQSIAELEALVDALESGDLSLEDSLKTFEKGVKITRECQTALKDAEKKVEILSRDNQGEITATPFDAPDDE